MKRVLAVFALALLLVGLVPSYAVADGSDDDHPRASAKELAGLGFAAAMAIGGSGYLLMRRRVRPAK